MIDTYEDVIQTKLELYRERTEKLEEIQYYVKVTNPNLNSIMKMKL